MQFRPRRRPEFAVDMTPMIDCVFQLLIFFLLSSSFVTPAVRLQLPRSSVPQPKDLPHIVVSLDAGGALYLNKEAIDRERLPSRLREMLAPDPSQPITVRADSRLEYRKVLDTILLVQQAGGAHLRLAYEESTP
jgi:biopolymer transport protein ExbD